MAAIVFYRRWQRAQRLAWTQAALVDARQRAVERRVPRAVSPPTPAKARLIVAPRPTRPHRLLEELGLLESQSAELMAAIAHGLSIIEITQRVALLHGHHRHVRALFGETRPGQAVPR